MPGAAHIPPHATDPSSYRSSFNSDETPSVAMSNWRRQRDKEEKVHRHLPIVAPSMKPDHSPLAGDKYGVTKKRRRKKERRETASKKPTVLEPKKHVLLQENRSIICVCVDDTYTQICLK